MKRNLIKPEHSEGEHVRLSCALVECRKRERKRSTDHIHQNSRGTNSGTAKMETFVYYICFVKYIAISNMLTSYKICAPECSQLRKYIQTSTQSCVTFSDSLMQQRNVCQHLDFTQLIFYHVESTQNGVHNMIRRPRGHVNSQ